MDVTRRTTAREHEQEHEHDPLLAGARLSQDDASAVILAGVRRKLFAAGQPKSVGRYELKRQIGAGGMGVVYAAYDPRLSRDVAIKVVRPKVGRRGDDGKAKDRMLREAQAMATLSHPNVLPIYDVGVEGDSVFLAMELVDGVTLRQWLEFGERTTAQVLATLTAAARGLAAAHAAGVVHRDFKPSNVLVGHDGRVFVMDFGLARSVAADPISARTGELEGGRFDESLTMTGTAVGSPAYMSPEQHRGEGPDPRSDQWSFCVTLHEAMCGCLPFPARSMDELRLRVEAGFAGFPKRATQVPRAVRRVIARGLQTDPGRRFASMDALVKALRPRSVRRAWVWMGGAAALGVGGWSLSTQEPLTTADCAAAAVQRAAVWDAARRRQLGTHFADADPWIRDTWQRAAASVDDYHQQWLREQHGVCTALGGDGDGLRAAARGHAACLDAAMAALDETLTTVGEVAPREAAEAVQMVAALPRLSECGRGGRRAAIADPSDSPHAAPIVKLLQRSRVLRRAERYADARAVAEEALMLAQALGAVRLEVEVLYQLGVVYRGELRYVDSARLAEEAVWAAEAAHLDQHVVEAAIACLRTATRASQPDAMRRWAAFASAKLAVAGEEPELRASLTHAMADAADARGEYREAERLALLAQSQAAAIPDEDAYASTIITVGMAHFRAKRHAASERSYARAQQILVRLYGPDHPTTLRTRQNIALAATSGGDFQRAIDIIEPLLPPLRAAHGVPSEAVASALNNLGVAYDGRGDAAKALALTEQSLAMRRQVRGESLEVALTAFNVALRLGQLDRWPEAAARYRASIDMVADIADPMHPMLAEPLVMLADALVMLEQLPEAQRRLERAAQIYEAMGAPPWARALHAYVWGTLQYEQGDRAAGRRRVLQALRDVQDSPETSRVPGHSAAMTAWLDRHPA